MSIELDLMRAPGRTYARVADGWALPGAAALRRPAIVALVIGGATCISATASADVRTMISTTACWAFIPAFQTLMAIALIASAPPARISRAAALDLFFAGHAPWSLWLLICAGVSAASPVHFLTSALVLITTIVPLLWTLLIIRAFCTHVLQLTPRDVVIRTALYEIVTWGLMLIVYGWAVAVWPRALGKLGW